MSKPKPKRPQKVYCIKLDYTVARDLESLSIYFKENRCKTIERCVSIIANNLALKGLLPQI